MREKERNMGEKGSEKRERMRVIVNKATLGNVSPISSVTQGIVV